MERPFSSVCGSSQMHTPRLRDIYHFMRHLSCLFHVPLYWLFWQRFNNGLRGKLLEIADPEEILRRAGWYCLRGQQHWTLSFPLFNFFNGKETKIRRIEIFDEIKVDLMEKGLFLLHSRLQSQTLVRVHRMYRVKCGSRRVKEITSDGG